MPANPAACIMSRPLRPTGKKGISYLPTIYTLFGRRETMVVKLDVRAGSPPTALVMLRRFYTIGWLEQMDAEWDQWENWFAELEESHTSHPILVFFRSQRQNGHATKQKIAVARTVSQCLFPFQTNATCCVGFEIEPAIHCQSRLYAT